MHVKQLFLFFKNIILTLLINFILSNLSIDSMQLHTYNSSYIPYDYWIKAIIEPIKVKVNCLGDNSFLS
jgi:hypothetical protein